MTDQNFPAPEVYVPEESTVTSAEEYPPEVTVADPVGEADPADVAEQCIEFHADEDAAAL